MDGVTISYHGVSIRLAGTPSAPTVAVNGASVAISPTSRVGRTICVSLDDDDNKEMVGYGLVVQDTPSTDSLLILWYYSKEEIGGVGDFGRACRAEYVLTDDVARIGYHECHAVDAPPPRERRVYSIVHKRHTSLDADKLDHIAMAVAGGPVEGRACFSKGPYSAAYRAANTAARASMEFVAQGVYARPRWWEHIAGPDDQSSSLASGLRLLDTLAGGIFTHTN